jgi:hypothetical protein
MLAILANAQSTEYFGMRGCERKTFARPRSFGVVGNQALLCRI